MNEPTITCPSCATEIKLTESLAAPLIEATRQEYEAKVAKKEREVAAREASLRDQHKALEQARNAIDEQVAEKLRSERSAIAAEEAKKAKLAASSDLEAKAREVADLQQVLVQRDAKLKEAQEAQAELLRKQRELDDAKAKREAEEETHDQIAELEDQGIDPQTLDFESRDIDRAVYVTGTNDEVLKNLMENGIRQVGLTATPVEMVSRIAEINGGGGGGE